MMKIVAIVVLSSFGMVTVALGQVCPTMKTQPCRVIADTDWGTLPPAIYCTSLVVQDSAPAHPPELASVVVQEESSATPSSVLSSPAPEVTISPEATSPKGPVVRSGSRRSANNAGMRRRNGVLGRFLYRFR